MGIQENKELVRRRLQMWNEDNEEIAEEIFATDIVSHEPNGVDIHGIDGMTQNPIRFRKAIPDLKMEYSQIIASDDQVAFRFELSGTPRGPIGPFEPTGEPIHFRGAILARIENNEFKEEWVYADYLDFYKQMGFVDFPQILDEV